MSDKEKMKKAFQNLKAPEDTLERILEKMKNIPIIEPPITGRRVLSWPWREYVHSYAASAWPEKMILLLTSPVGFLFAKTFLETFFGKRKSTNFP